jgi:hypothetical protein
MVILGLTKLWFSRKDISPTEGGWHRDMRKIITCVLIGVFMLTPLLAMAQVESGYVEQRPGTILDNPIKKTFSLLDPQRMHISHSYSFSYLSGGGQSGAVGMYFGSIRYQISKPLTLRVGLAYTHNPMTAFGANTEGIVSEGLYPSFSLNYRPSPNLFLEIGFQRVPGYMYWAPSPWETAPTGWWRTR